MFSMCFFLGICCALPDKMRIQGSASHHMWLQPLATFEGGCLKVWLVILFMRVQRFMAMVC